MATASTPEHLAFPREGISIKYLLDVFSKSDKITDESTTADVSKVVLEETKGEKTSMVDFWKSQEASSHHVGVADVYIIHLWSYNFKQELLSCLRNYLNKTEKIDTFVWLDVFSLNLHLLQRQLRVYQWWGNDFVVEMKPFKEVVIAWSQWEKALPISRAWCSWEIWIALASQKQLAIALTEEEDAELQEKLINGDSFQQLAVALTNFNILQTSASDRRMYKRTIAAVKKLPLDLETFNETAVSVVKQWWLAQAMSFMKDFQEEFSEGKSVEELRNLMKFLNALSFLARSELDIELANEISLIAIALIEKNQRYALAFPREVAREYNNLGVICSETGDNEGAVQYGERAIGFLKDFVFAESQKFLQLSATPETPVFDGLIQERGYIATSLNNMANFYVTLGEFELAIDRYTESIQLKVEIFGPDNNSVAAGLNNLGVAYSQLEDFASAERVFRQALQIRIMNLGNDSVEAADTRFNLAEVLWQEDHGQEALKEAKQAASVAKKQLGEEHELTQDATQLVNTIKEYQKRNRNR